MRLVGLHFFPFEDAANYACITDKVRTRGKERKTEEERARERETVLLGAKTAVMSANG